MRQPGVATIYCNPNQLSYRTCCLLVAAMCTSVSFGFDRASSFMRGLLLAPNLSLKTGSKKQS